MAQKHTEQEKPHGQMTVAEAGRLGGHKGGQRVKHLIEEGKRLEREGGAENGEDIENTQEEEDGEA